MRIAAIEWSNFLCYRGDYRLELEAKPYAVFAERDGDPEDSNGSGKTGLLEIFDFVLYGRHRWPTEDEFITRGEPVAKAILTLDDGSRIVRQRERGKRTTLHYFHPERAPKGMMKDAAQEEVERIVGLSGEDFLATCYFQQRQMGRLILAKPGPRMEMVTGWLRLGPLERCEERVRKSMSASLEEEAKARAQLESLDLVELSTLDLGHVKDPSKELIEEARSKLAEMLGGHDELVAQRTNAAREARDAVEENGERVRAKKIVEEFEALLERGRVAKQALDEMNPGELRSELEVGKRALAEAEASLHAARENHRAKSDLARGRFDGRCPVAGIQCPIAGQINASSDRNAELAAVSRAELDAAESARRKAVEGEEAARSKVLAYERAESRLRAMHDEAERQEQAYEEAKKMRSPEDGELLRVRLDEAERRLREVGGSAERLRERLRQLAEVDERREVLRRKAREAGRSATLHREAIRIFGKQGAQRVVAEGALSEIEAGANAILSDAGAGVSLAVRWSREGKDLASACDACGHPFPSSAKVKVCERCKAARGPNLVNKLDVELSDRSGALEDLGGFALQLAASAWLRAERGSAWSVLLLDEPTAAMDKRRRRAFASHLSQMFHASAFRQAFVTSHTPEVLESLPGRILISAGGNGSSVRVVS